MVDCSETGALTSSIPRPFENINSEIDYRGVMFLDQRNSIIGTTHCRSDVSICDKEYDCVLIDYGYNLNTKGLLDCDQLIFVTDQQAHNIGRLTIPNNLRDNKKCLIIKNLVRSRITPSYILSELMLDNLSSTQIYVVDQDELDSKCKINCQYDGTFHFMKLSTQTKSIIMGLSVALYPDITKKDLKEAYKKAERGVWNQ
jgi:hypothetical protein